MLPTCAFATGIFSLTNIHWLPDPLLSQYCKQFEKVFGIETLECDRPSLAVTREKEQERSSLFTGAKVRGVVECLACDKPRCVFTDKQSTYAAINVMPHPPQVGVGGALVGGLTQNLGPRGRDFDPE